MHLLDQTPEGLRSWLDQHKQPKFRAAQIWEWLATKRVSEFAQMTNLPTGLRQELGEHFHLWQAMIANAHVADDGTEKVIVRMAGQKSN